VASPARVVALDVLLAIHGRDAYANLALDAELKRRTLTQRDTALATELAYGTLRAEGTLDWVLQRFSKRPLEELEPVVLDALRLGAYQLLYLDVSDHAAVNETVDQVRAHTHIGAAGYANAVLRALARGRDDLPWPSREGDLAGYLSLVLWHPRWLVERWIDELGLETTEALCRADNSPPDVTLRANVLRTTRKSLLGELAARGVDVRAGKIAAEAIHVRRAGSVTAMPEFERGEIYVQDEASMAVSHLVDARPGETVADLCAAPGGKATHLAELMGNEGHVMGVDVNEKRLKLVADSARRLCDTIVEPVLADAASWRPERAVDRVLLDAPCSGLGVLARRAESRWRKGAQQIDELAGLQSILLDNAATVLRPGGVLVYSTCTISRRENQDQIDAFLARHPDFAPADAAAELGVEAPSGPGWIQFLPHVHGTDGIFVGKLTRGPRNLLASTREQK